MQEKFISLLLEQVLYENDSCLRPLACIAMETWVRRVLLPPLAEFFTIISLVPAGQGRGICYGDTGGLNFSDHPFTRLLVQTERGFYFNYLKLL